MHITNQIVKAVLLTIGNFPTEHGVSEPIKVVAQEYTVLTYLGETANISWTITGRPLPKLADIHITRVRGLVDKQTVLYDDR